MSTRCLTVVREIGTDNEVVIYHQSDGYPEWHGRELYTFLDGLVVTNGIRSGLPDKTANGAWCLAAQLVKHFKEAIGGVYLYPSHTRDCDERYIYYVDVVEWSKIRGTCKPVITVWDAKEKRSLFYGYADAMMAWLDQRARADAQAEADSS